MRICARRRGRTAALEESLQAEKKPAGSAAARPAPRADRTNSRRVRRKLELSSLEGFGFAYSAFRLSNIFHSLSAVTR